MDPNDALTRHPNIAPLLLAAALTMFAVLAFNLPFLYGQRPDLPQVWEVKFEGNSAYRDILLNPVVFNKKPEFWRRRQIEKDRDNRLDLAEVKKDVQRLTRYYQRRGFPNVRVDYRIENLEPEWRRRVVFEIDEGVEQILVEITSQWNWNGQERDAALEAELESRWSKLKLRTNRRFEQILVPEINANITDFFANRGYPFADILLNLEESFAKDSVYADIWLTPGPKVWLDEIKIEGEETVSERLVIRETDLRTGDLYQKNKLYGAQKALFMHQLFRFATVGIDEQVSDSLVSISVKIREEKLRAVQVRAGAGYEDILRAQFSWTHRNVMRWGHSFSVTGKASFIEQRAALGYLVPYVFNNRSKWTTSPFAYRLQERSFLLETIGINTSMIYQFSSNLTASAGFEYTQNNESRRNIVGLEETPSSLFDLSTFDLAAFYELGSLSRKDGWLIQPYYQLSGLITNATFRFQKLGLEVRRYLPLGDRSSLALRGDSGLIFDLRQDSLPASVKFYQGGTNSIRGFQRQQLGPKFAQFDTDGNFLGYVAEGGLLSLGFNLELRRDTGSLIRNSGIAVFLDGGQVWRRRNLFDISEIQYATGLGIRYRSPIGPLRLDFGYKLNPTDEDLGIYQGQDFGGRFSRFAVHLSLGQSF